MPLDAGQLLVLILQKNQETRNRQEVEMINILFLKILVCNNTSYC